MMKDCEQFRDRMILYLDDELESTECADLMKHLDSCRACRAIFESERAFLESVRGVRVLQTSSPELRERAREILESSSDSTGSAVSVIEGPKERRWLRPRYLLPIAAMLLVALAVGVWRFGAFNSKPERLGLSEFARMAANAHMRHIQGQLPLEISSEVPERISDWFIGKVPFVLRLPNYQEASGQEKLYRLEGARLVGYKTDYAAYIAYQMQTRPISLVVTSEAVAQPSGGEAIRANGIEFHFNSINGLKVITWSDRGLTYALVSDLEERGQQSCVVCHAGTKDKNLIEPLKPR
jgi:anti-sigma factor RsiW